MTKRPAKLSKAVAAPPADYAPLLANIKARVQAAWIKAGLAANRELLDRFSSIVEPSFGNIQRLHLQILNLRQTCDLLLPRLLSGQVVLR